jgi:hypothetical protein
MVYVHLGNGFYVAVGKAGVKKTEITKISSDSPYTASVLDDNIGADASGGNLTITLPTAVGYEGKEFTIKRTDISASTNFVIIATTSSQTISGAANEWLATGEFITLKSNGTNWDVINRTTPSLFGSFFKRGTSSPNDRRYVAGVNSYSSLLTSTTAPAVNTLWALPFIVARTTKFDKLSFMVTTLATAGGVARAGIYRDNGNTYPGVLYFDTGSIAVDAGSTSAPRDTSITAGLQTFPAGLYWLAWECGTAAPQIRVLPGIGTLFSLHGYGNDMAVSTAYGYSVVHTFGSLPDPYTTSAGNLTGQSSVSNPVPAVAMRPI